MQFHKMRQLHERNYEGAHGSVAACVDAHMPQVPSKATFPSTHCLAAGSQEFIHNHRSAQQSGSICVVEIHITNFEMRISVPWCFQTQFQGPNCKYRTS